MTQLAKVTAQLVDMLPPKKRQALFDYARYLVERTDEEEWDRQFSSPHHRPKLKALMSRVERELAEGKSRPLRLGDL